MHVKWTPQEEKLSKYVSLVKHTLFFFLSDEGYITKGYLKCDAHLPSMAPKIDKLNS